MGVSSVSNVPSQKIESPTQSNAVEQRDRASTSQKVRQKDESVARSEKQVAEAYSHINVVV
jgi:hypothetical protein